MARALVAIVVPVHNEKDNLVRFHEEVSAVMRQLGDYDWEFVFVDDGSTDGSFEVLQTLRDLDPRVAAIRFPRNFGSHVAIAAGASNAIWRRFCEVIGRAELTRDPGFATTAARRDRRDEIAALIQDWTSQRPKAAVVEIPEKKKDLPTPPGGMDDY